MQDGPSTHQHNPDSFSVTGMGTTSHQHNPTSFYSDYKHHGPSFYSGLYCTKSYQQNPNFFTVMYMIQRAINIIQHLFTVTKVIMVHRPINIVQALFTAADMVQSRINKIQTLFNVDLHDTMCYQYYPASFYSDKRHHGTSTYKHNSNSFLVTCIVQRRINIIQAIFSRT